MAADTHTLTIPSSTRFLEDVREFVETHAEHANFSEIAVTQMKMAVDEACTNVIEHSYGGQSGHSIDIAVLVYPDKLVVVIKDKGIEFDRKAYKEPDLIQFAKTKKSGGFGVHLMKKLMDEVEYRRSSGINECRMTKLKS